MTEVDAARICHEANRAYCLSLGDYSQAPWEDAPEWQKESAIKGVAFHLEALRRDENPHPEASHESWLEEKRRDGWVYGPVKDPDKKQHPCFVPFNELPKEQQAKDYLFSGIVESLWDAGVLR